MASEQTPQGQSPGQSGEAISDHRENEGAPRVESPRLLSKAHIDALHEMLVAEGLIVYADEKAEP
jgi:hypothetical protein